MDLSRYTIQGSQDVAKVLAQNNLRWITLRWYYMILLAVIAIAATLLSSFTLDRVAEYVIILLAGYTVNASLLVLVKKASTMLGVQRFALGAQLLLDLLMGGVIIYIQGGVDARTTVLFAIPIIASGLAFIRPLVLGVAALSGVVYIATILLHGWLIRGGIDWAEYAVPIVFYPLLFLVIARVVEFLTTVEINDIRERTYNSFLSLLAHQLKHPASAAKPSSTLSSTTIRHITPRKPSTTYRCSAAKVKIKSASSTTCSKPRRARASMRTSSRSISCSWSRKWRIK